MIRTLLTDKCSRCLTQSSALTILIFPSRQYCTSSSSSPSFADKVNTNSRKARRRLVEEDSGPTGGARGGQRERETDNSCSRRSRVPSRGSGLPRSEDIDIMTPSSQQHEEKEKIVPPPPEGVKSVVVNSTSPSLDAYNRLISSRFEDWTAQITTAEREWDAAIHNLKRYITIAPPSSEKGGTPTGTPTSCTSPSANSANSGDKQQQKQDLSLSLLPLGPFEARQLEERLATWRREQNRIESQRSYALHNLQLQNKKATRHRQQGDEETNPPPLLVLSSPASPSTVFDVFPDAANLLALSSQRLAEHRHKEQNSSSLSPPTALNYHEGEVEPVSTNTSTRLPTLRQRSRRSITNRRSLTTSTTSTNSSFLESSEANERSDGGAFFTMKNEEDEVAAMLDPCGFTLSAVVVGVDNQQQEKLYSHQLKVGNSGGSSSGANVSSNHSNRGAHEDSLGVMSEGSTRHHHAACSDRGDHHYDQPLSMPKRTNLKEDERGYIDKSNTRREKKGEEPVIGKTTPFMAFAAERLKVLSHNAAAAGGVAAGAGTGVAGAEGSTTIINSSSNNATILSRLSQLSLEYQRLPRYLRSVFEAMCAPRTYNNDRDGSYDDGDTGERSGGGVQNGDTVRNHRQYTQEAGVGGHPSADEDRDREHALMFLRELEAFVSYSIFTVQTLVKSGVIPTKQPTTSRNRSSGVLRKEVGSNALLASALSVVPHTWQLMNTEEKMRWCPSIDDRFNCHSEPYDDHQNEDDEEEKTLVTKGGKGTGDGKVSGTQQQQGVRAGRLMLARAPSPPPKTALRSKSGRQNKNNASSEQQSFSDLTASFENRGTRLLEEKRGIVSEGSAQHGVEEATRGESNFVASPVASVSSVPIRDGVEDTEDSVLVEEDDDPLKWLSRHMTML